MGNRNNDNKNAEKTKVRSSFHLPDRYFYLILIGISAIVRIPFLKSFDLVTYDGTYYINQTRAIMSGSYRPGFPIGYPAFTALFLPILRDGVRAAQAVSILAGFGSLIVFYALLRKYVARRYAMAGSLLLALTPIFLRISTTTLSESLYIFWLLLGVLLFAGERELLSGLCLGMASITRPESLGIFGIMLLLRIRRLRRALLFAAGFIILYSVSVSVHSIATGDLQVLPKSQFFGLSVESWKTRESWLEFEGKGKLLDKAIKEAEKPNIAADYLARMPAELLLLARHATPFLFLLALYGIFRKRTFLLAMLFPFLVFPLFTVRTEARYLLPYIPAIILYAMIGLEGVRIKRLAAGLYILAVISPVFGFYANREQLTDPVSKGYQWAKKAGETIRYKIKPGDRIADRKPFLAFYAEGEYYEIPLAPYDETMGHLASRGVEFLAVAKSTIKQFRPFLLPLLYNRPLIKGELRYKQDLFSPNVIIYRWNAGRDPLKRRLLHQKAEEQLFGTVWSPDGEKIAFRGCDNNGHGAIYIIPSEGGTAQKTVAEECVSDNISWAPDSRSIAFANHIEGNIDIFVINESGELERITTHQGQDISPCWSPEGNEIYFSSNRSGADNIWSKNLETGEFSQITEGSGFRNPSVSPDGARIAYIRTGEAMFIQNLSTSEVIRAKEPTKVYSSPTWSPSGNFIAVTALDWGKTDIYLLTADGKNCLVLTKTAQNEGDPTWSPDGSSLATVMSRGDITQLWIISGIEPYKERLLDQLPVNILEDQ